MDFEGVVKVKKVLHLVIGYAAIDDSLFTRVNNDKRQLNGRVWGWRAFALFTLFVPFDQIFECNLLETEDDHFEEEETSHLR